MRNKQKRGPFCIHDLDPQSWHSRFRHLHDEFHREHHADLQRNQKYFRYIRPASIVFNILIFYLLFSWIGFKGLGILFAVLLAVKEIIQFIFLMRLEKRIFKPIEKLRQGVTEIAKGNYNIKIEYAFPSDLGLLIAAFNEMAQRLYEIEKMKTEYEENRKTLIANISHDLKTPITAIQGYIEAILDGTAESSDNKDKYLATIHNNILYVNKLIEDLFLFSRLDMEKLDFYFERLSMRDFMDDLMEEYRFELEERKIQFEYITMLPKKIEVQLDRKRFHQALNNIVNNAIKHGAGQNLSIKVELYHQHGTIYIDIQDNGPGIPPDKLPHIFDRFFRVDTERTKDFTSTGLGLAITKELVEAHGGEISVASTLQEGSCFTILLPIWKENEGEIHQ